MPLRDHFYPPLARQTSWDLFHGLWPAMIVLRRNAILPSRYAAGPHVHLGTDEYAVQVHDVERQRRLVAVVEIVSPSNKDRPESRRVFVAKCEALLRRGVSVCIIDLVTSKRFNLYGELLDLIDQEDPSLGDRPPATYAVACRWIERGSKRILETWSYSLTLGQPLPTLPLWVAENFHVPLELEVTYEAAVSGTLCAVIGIASEFGKGGGIPLASEIVAEGLQPMDADTPERPQLCT